MQMSAQLSNFEGPELIVAVDIEEEKFGCTCESNVTFVLHEQSVKLT